MADSAHYRAAEAFTRQVRDQYGDVVNAVMLYGSVARNEERGPASDVDLIVLIDDEVDRAEYERRIRDLAYDVELERGVILSLVVLSAADYYQRETPFLQHVQRDAEPLYG